MKNIKFEDNPNSIKYYVKKYILSHTEQFEGKVTVDVPAGNGVTARLVKEALGEVLAFDLFPEYFKEEGIKCVRADISKGLPLEDKSVHNVICQEGLEHFSDQLKTFEEFNRILKENGSLFITTPNCSNLRSKLSYLLSESERAGSLMPPNEIDSIWMSNQGITNEIYLGHVFLTGIFKLRLLSKLSGFKIKKIIRTQISPTALFLFIFTYPFIFLSNLITYNKNNTHKPAQVKKTYKELFALSINPTILLTKHLFIEFKKEKSLEQTKKDLKSIHKSFLKT